MAGFRRASILRPEAPALGIACVHKVSMGTLVLLPGMDGTGKLFQPFQEALDGRFPTSAISYPKDQYLSYEELKARVAPVLPTGTSYVLLGESFSRPLAISIASSKPAGLRGVILCASFVSRPAPRWLGGFASLLQSGASPRLLQNFL